MNTLSHTDEGFRKRYRNRLVRVQGWARVKQARVRARQERNRLKHLAEQDRRNA